MSDTNQNPQPIIDLILADINAVIPNLSSLVASYRLLVGASEEIHRTPEICPEVFERAVRRADNAGTLIDVFLELLCCKVAFSSDFLKISCAPVDLFRLLANKSPTTDVPFHTAEQVVEMEALRRVLECCHHKGSCLPDKEVLCPRPKGAPEPPAPAPSSNSDIQEVEAVALQQLVNTFGARTNEAVSPETPSASSANPAPSEIKEASTDNGNSEEFDNEHESRVRCKHLYTFHNKKSSSKEIDKKK
ncbi:hypothetical protein [Pelosinus baikalensis]|uniref:Uncharacterized protein n=1 Tax=Pelosinus baikalensis TaxID=2892015 RepID=A0ABS8I106_9FIRM|nr:hypothetical protein [Pelosinus baikalensis]MCC5468197.1 hypothetical protein [Pelosinus baikalensis]